MEELAAGDTLPGGADFLPLTGGSLSGDLTVNGQAQFLYNDNAAPSIYAYNSAATSFAVTAQFLASTAANGAYAILASGAGVNARVIYSTATGTNGVAIDGFTSNATGIGVRGTAGFAGAIAGSFTNAITTVDALSLGTETDFITGISATVETFKVTNAGFITASGLHLDDSEHILLGTDSDLDIYHNGGNGVVKNYTGNLFIESAAATIAAFTQTAA